MKIRKSAAVVVLNYKGVNDTLSCLESLRAVLHDGIDLHLIVVENGSDDGSDLELSQLEDAELIVNERNLGFSGGMNSGIVYALSRKCDYIVILNNDTYVDNLFLVKLIEASRWADIVAPKIYFAPGYEFHKDRYSKGEQGKVIWYGGGEIDWENILGVHRGVDEVDSGQFKRGSITLATGCCMLVKREVFEKIGLLDEKYFLYLEDMDFCYRARKAGFKILFEPQSVIWHKNAASAGGSGSALQDYYITRNRLLFAFKYAPLRTKIALIKHIASGTSNKTRRKALFDFLLFRFGKQHGKA